MQHFSTSSSKKMQFFTMKMAFFEVQIKVKSCSAYKDASLYQIRCLYLFFYNFFRSTGTELRRRLYILSFSSTGVNKHISFYLQNK